MIDKIYLEITFAKELDNDEMGVLPYIIGKALEESGLKDFYTCMDKLKVTNDSKPCIWSKEEFDEYNMWNTECGESFCLETDTPKENKMKYCCYCGKELGLA